LDVRRVELLGLRYVLRVLLGVLIPEQQNALYNRD
jgi:hypothetical protein